MLTYHHYGPVMFIWEQFRLRYHSLQSLKLAWKLFSKILLKSPRGQWVEGWNTGHHFESTVYIMIMSRLFLRLHVVGPHARCSSTEYISGSISFHFTWHTISKDVYWVTLCIDTYYALILIMHWYLLCIDTYYALILIMHWYLLCIDTYYALILISMIV